MFVFEFVLLASRTGNFFMDIVFPAVAGAIVIALILNSILNHWGYTLW